MQAALARAVTHRTGRSRGRARSRPSARPAPAAAGWHLQTQGANAVRPVRRLRSWKQITAGCVRTGTDHTSQTALSGAAVKTLQRQRGDRQVPAASLIRQPAARSTPQPTAAGPVPRPTAARPVPRPTAAGPVPQLTATISCSASCRIACKRARQAQHLDWPVAVWPDTGRLCLLRRGTVE